jgi:hypothetical protein
VRSCVFQTRGRAVVIVFALAICFLPCHASRTPPDLARVVFRRWARGRARLLAIWVYKLVPQLNTLIRDAIFAQAVADRVAVCFSGFCCLSSQRDCNYECYDAALLA